MNSSFSYDLLCSVIHRLVNRRFRIPEQKGAQCPGISPSDGFSGRFRIRIASLIFELADCCRRNEQDEFAGA